MKIFSRQDRAWDHGQSCLAPGMTAIGAKRSWPLLTPSGHWAEDISRSLVEVKVTGSK